MRNVQIKVIKITYDEALAQRYLTDGIRPVTFELKAL